MWQQDLFKTSLKIDTERTTTLSLPYCGKKAVSEKSLRRNTVSVLL